jgi:excisionase family DNA binding protein
LSPEVIEQLAIEHDRWLSVQDLMARTGFSRKIVVRMIEEGRIPAIKLNGQWGISRRKFAKALDAGFLLPSGRHRRAA